MASSFLGPESPKPYAVISESYEPWFNIPRFTKNDDLSFGEVYEEKMREYLYKYLDIGTTDKICYVGEFRDSIVDILQDKFCLLTPITKVFPAHFHYAHTDHNRILPIRIKNVGTEEYFRRMAELPDNERNVFDKIILKDTAHFLENPREVYKNILKCLSEKGLLLIIDRPTPLNTLPISELARKRFEDYEAPYMRILKDLQDSHLHAEWEIETIPIVIQKRKWYTLLKEKYPPRFRALSHVEVMSSVRELTEGVMKYHEPIVQFSDRLLFITACAPQNPLVYPNLQRYSRNEYVPFPGLQRTYELEVTPELESMVTPRKKKEGEPFKFLW
ncbi:uncharacterized protein LOC126822617 [Patella vulgata]|uniref:uncharacterized protein LOC126822617 n=1 Tax=Patella vulgata TaxID=6465 RepID=UPI00217F8AC5|nr:uncharacterized protein LOC126822617 [Patella vulgata]XP_050407542.1 uncharacterized protein LOC126822617 [Patella vulgata]XP_050407549.1 uncharacterized protein LOC126822617 [Patella vulgata]